MCLISDAKESSRSLSNGMGKYLPSGSFLLSTKAKLLADSKQAASLAYGILLLVAGLDGLGQHVRNTTLAELPHIPRLLQVI